jgi:hypothetical protein
MPSLSAVTEPCQAHKVPGSSTGLHERAAIHRCPKRKDAELAYLRPLVEEAKVSGLVARAIEKTGARDVSVAPATK